MPAAITLIATVAASAAHADEAATTLASLVVVVESSDVSLGGAAVRNTLGVRLGRPVGSLLDASRPRAGLTLTVVIDRQRQRAVARLTNGAGRAAERTIGLPRPPAAALTSIADACAALLAELGPEPEPFGRIVQDVRDPFAAHPPAPAPRPEVPSPWPTVSAPHSTSPLAGWPAGPARARAPADEPASGLSAPEPGFADMGDL